ncbi:MAG: hypothetical protein CO094_07940 [Anaerolineae bacterium CG_4_9_14_3_um_filter_57_17]|nr:diguanylate cyclase [bacterium]NCT20977.1 diguanylate cyclase [bacterium]OIO85104.1 MAG: hypothetical protein AUK01_07085 [Anaerolineae bacterium CG2_30_57_67]PJB66145.1 MAG: hypothetical protein CO094_07940 [Anaerolineae bacterium CG_4_9_14_3_um_filter_57_17]
MEIRLYVEMLRRSWWIIVLTVLLALNAALVSSYLTTPLYSSSARFIVSPNLEQVSGKDLVNSLTALDKRSILSTYAEFMSSRRIFQETLQHIQIDPLAVKDYDVTTVVLPEAAILELTVSGPDPVVAALLANSVGQRAIDYISLFYSSYDISVLDPALPAALPYTPQPARDAALALGLGLVGGAALAILSEQLRIPLESYRQRLRVDSETGVFNSRYFRTLLDAELSSKPNDLLSVGLVDVGGLQEVLETLPPVASQRLLRKVTEILRKELRGNDIVGRWNETSFIVMLPTTPGTAAARTFQRIYQALLEPSDIEGYNMTASMDPHIGGSVFSNDLASEELLAQAQSALDQARRDPEKPVYIWQMKSPFWASND